jgi:HlyD family secretion protein
MESNTMNEEQKFTKKRKGFLLLALALVVSIGIGFGIWQTARAYQQTSAQATTTAGAYSTVAVRKSNIALSISGAGSVLSAHSVDLGFPVEKEIAKLNVQVSDQVKTGQVLASLDGMDELKLAVQEQQIAVKNAQKALDDLKNKTATNLAQALLDQASAEKTYEEAKSSALQKGDGRCQQSVTQEYYFQYIDAQRSVNEWESYLADGNTGYGTAYIQNRLASMHKERDKAYYNLKYCESYTDQEIQESQATLAMAKAKFNQATRTYQNLKANSGIDTTDLEIAQATLTDTQLQLGKAQNDLTGATLIAPIDGTVTAVNGKVGSTPVKGTAVITISVVDQPQVQVNMDETDLQNFAVGCAAKVTFDSLSGQTFTGVVTQVSPMLVAVQDVNVVQGLVELQKNKTASGRMLPLGLTALVEVTCQQADNVLIAPVTGLYEESGQNPYVYILTQQGQPEKREVTIGIKTVASVEIRSGLNEGDLVITSQIKGQ